MAVNPRAAQQKISMTHQSLLEGVAAAGRIEVGKCIGYKTNRYTAVIPEVEITKTDGNASLLRSGCVLR